ncbi:Sec-independent protein translocase TatA [Archaeoglobus sulfaticallidus PM70-1]|uniref:Sec-independent protein translocase protein TatA n=1 Tax=Archaeoglobus sulfaticallidus PM70-1 TaxID=387631 RepID=N0BF46_9EURY|nr:twin-arginine translocase TatA/TatE family subunit [Archaeoglobus sulfaticallidus]AGK61643.1 Sec-independent protein translocase TatA [Archaeoglobus sulfaticallidus PM70-1]
MFSIGPNELLAILLIAFLLFGASKLPELARSLGKSMGEFKKAQKEAEIELRRFEKDLEEGKYTPQDKRAKLEKIAKDLGIDTEGKSDDEILEEINKALPKTEKAEP